MFHCCFRSAHVAEGPSPPQSLHLTREIPFLFISPPPPPRIPTASSHYRSFPWINNPLASPLPHSSEALLLPASSLIVSFERALWWCACLESRFRREKMCYEATAESSKHRRLQLQSSPSRASGWQEVQLKEAFDLMDRDGDGTIKAEDLNHFLVYSLKSDHRDEDVETMISLADRDKNGAVDFEEFLSLVQSRILQRSASLSSLGSKALADMFRVLDRDGDGVLSEKDLSGVMGTLGQALSSEDLLAMLQTATGSDRRQVTFEDFCLLLRSAGAQ